ncbi:MAG: hypothetical protein ACFFDP_10600 [Promethearchaeota archaeon]
MTQNISKNVKLFLIPVIVITVAIIAAIWATVYMPPPTPLSPPDYPIFFTLKTILASVNITLLLILLSIYIDIYRQTRSKFTIGLLIFTLTILLQVLTSHPVIHQLFGLRGTGLGPFLVLPDVFTLIASVILLYLAYK